MQIYDGREHFYQWDKNQKITSNRFRVGDEIHFHNIKTSTALPLIAYELDGKVVVDVPNILLQSSQPITVYRYINNADNSGYTIEEQIFKVTQRAKPDDYVYTETEIYTIKTAVDKALLEAKESGEFDGKDGYTPQKGIDYFDGKDGEPFTYDDFTEEQLAALKGEPGDDYVLTESDKEEIANIVISNFTDVSEVGQ